MSGQLADTSAPAPTRRRPERVDANRAPVTWLARPVPLSGDDRTLVVGFCTPPGPPEWLQEVLDAAA